jgi:hypothetical protein
MRADILSEHYSGLSGSPGGGHTPPLKGVSAGCPVRRTRKRKTGKNLASNRRAESVPRSSWPRRRKLVHALVGAPDVKSGCRADQAEAEEDAL